MRHKTILNKRTYRALEAQEEAKNKRYDNHSRVYQQFSNFTEEELTPKSLLIERIYESRATRK